MEVKHRFPDYWSIYHSSEAWWMDIKGQTEKGYVLFVTKILLANTYAEISRLIIGVVCFQMSLQGISF